MKCQQVIAMMLAINRNVETFAQLHKTTNYVIPAKAGIQYYQAFPRFRLSPE